jgi:hypothetical protein
VKLLLTPTRAAIAALAVLALATCGSEEKKGAPLPADFTQKLTVQLDLVQSRIDATRENDTVGSCKDIDLKSYPDIQDLVDGLPPNTDSALRDALDQSLSRLRKLTEAECSDLEDRIRERQDTTQRTTPQPSPEPAPPQTEIQPPKTDEQTVPGPKPKKPKKLKENGNGGTPPGRGGGQNGGGVPAPAPEGD